MKKLQLKKTAGMNEVLRPSLNSNYQGFSFKKFKLIISAWLSVSKIKEQNLQWTIFVSYSIISLH